MSTVTNTANLSPTAIPASDRAAERAERRAMREAKLREGIHLLTAEDLTELSAHARRVANRHQPRLDADEIESGAILIAASMLAEGSDIPRIATIRGAVKVSARRVIADRMRNRPRAERPDTIDRYTVADTTQLTKVQKQAIAAAIESSHLMPLSGKYAKQAKLDAAAGNDRGAEGKATRRAESAAMRKVLTDAIGADVLEAIAAAYVEPKTAKYETAERAAGTLLSAARINWSIAGESRGVARATLYSQVTRALGDVERVKLLAENTAADSLTRRGAVISPESAAAIAAARRYRIATAVLARVAAAEAKCNRLGGHSVRLSDGTGAGFGTYWHLTQSADALTCYRCGITEHAPR